MFHYLNTAAKVQQKNEKQDRITKKNYRLYRFCPWIAHAKMPNRGGLGCYGHWFESAK